MFGTETEVYYDPGHGFFGGCASRGVGGDDFDVYKVASGGGNPTNLTDGAEWIGGTFHGEPADLFPSFSPDGKQIAFASSRNTPRDKGIHSLWKMDAGGGNPTLVKVTNAVFATDWMTALPVGDVVRINALEPCAYEEGPTPGVFTIERTGVTDGDVDVTIEVASSSTATSGLDFEEIPTTVTIPDGTNLVNLLVFPIDDDVLEPEETIENGPPSHRCRVDNSHLRVSIAQLFSAPDHSPAVSSWGGDRPPLRQPALPESGIQASRARY